MAASLLRSCLGVLVFLAAAELRIRADEPDAELLPPPRELTPEPTLAPGHPVLGTFPIPAYYRTSHYAIWQFYAVDQRGYFRPRVVYSPIGGYYLYNGQPYPGVLVEPLIWRPIVTDTAAGPSH